MEWAPATAPVGALVAAGGALYVATAFFSPDAIIKVSATGTGARDTAWDPDVDGVAEALAASGSSLDSSLYIAGDLFEVDGALRRGLAKLALAGTGAVDPEWDPSEQSGFSALLVSGDSIFVGGAFTGTVGGRSAARLAKLSTGGTGAADAGFAANVNGTVRALALSGSDLYIGGDFASAGGQAHLRLARLSAATGAGDATFTPGPTGTVRALAASPTRLIAGGGFAGVDRFSARGLAIFEFTKPAVSLTVPAEGSRYRLGQVVDAAYSCSGTEGDPEVVACAGTVPSGSAIDTTTAGVRSFTVTATANSGNASSKTVSYTVDASVPLIQIGALPGGATYAIGEQVAVSYSCTDADGDGDVATCAGPVPSGGLLDTTTAGAHTFTVTASDLAGNTSTASVAYSVRPAAEIPPPLTPLTPLTPADVKKPSLTAVTLTPSAFRAERSGSPTSKATNRKPKRGTRVTYKLSETAKVTFTIIRPKKGKTRAKTLGRFTVAGKAGANRFVFRGRVGGKTIPPGRYRLTAQAADTAGNRSTVVGKPFTVKR